MSNKEQKSKKSIATKKYFEDHPEAKQSRSEQMKKLWENPEYREKQTKSIQIAHQDPKLCKSKSERMKKWWEDPEHVEFQSKRQTALVNSMWGDPEMKDRLLKSAKTKWENPEIRKTYCESSHKRWEDPEEHEKASLAQQKRFEDPNEHIKISNSLKKFMEDPIVRKQISERVIKSFEELNIPEKLSKIMKEKFEDPEFKATSLSKSHSPEAMKKLSESLKRGFEEHPERREQISKNQKEWMSNPEHCPNWKGGSSFLPYCPKFNKELKNNVRNFFGNKCVLCERTKEENNNTNLVVHHIFTEKMACCETRIEEMDEVRKRLPVNVAHFGEEEFTEEEIMYIRMMVPLCMKCHGKQNAASEKLPYEQTTYRKFFAELILNEYGGQCYLK
jgi:hypothetical protein